MTGSEKYLMEKHEIIRDDYCEYGNFPANCAIFALEISNIMISEGKIPEIYTVDASGLFSRKLYPLQYGGKVKWKKQNVCCSGGFAYDPVIGKPVPIEDYCKIMFGREIKMKRNPEIEKLIGFKRSVTA